MPRRAIVTTGRSWNDLLTGVAVPWQLDAADTEDRTFPD